MAYTRGTCVLFLDSAFKYSIYTLLSLQFSSGVHFIIETIYSRMANKLLLPRIGCRYGVNERASELVRGDHNLRKACGFGRGDLNDRLMNKSSSLVYGTETEYQDCSTGHNVL
jgi:hypothetical protein